MFIQEFYEFLFFLEGQNIASRRPPEQIDKALYFVSNDIYMKYFDHYAKTKKVSTFLDQFKRRKNIPISNGIGTLPGDYAIYREVYKMAPIATGETAGAVKIDVVDDNFWNHRRNRKVGPASLSRPIARIDFTKESTPAKVIELYPTTVTSIELQYFKTLSKPKYAYTLSGTRYVFHEGNSVDIEFSPLVYPDLLNRVLQVVGVNLRENQLVQYTEMFKSQEQRK